MRDRKLPTALFLRGVPKTFFLFATRRKQALTSLCENPGFGSRRGRLQPGMLLNSKCRPKGRRYEKRVGRRFHTDSNAKVAPRSTHSSIVGSLDPSSS